MGLVEAAPGFQSGFSHDSFDRVTAVYDRHNADQYQCYTYDRYNRLKTAFTTGDSACGAYNSAVGITLGLREEDE